MTQPDLGGQNDPAAVMDYRQQAREFLGQSREYLAAGRLHQGSEKGWGAAAWMVKAVAEAQGWQYDRHEHFHVVLNNARVMTGNDRLYDLSGAANNLHRNFYVRRQFLTSQEIGLGLDRMAELFDILEPLADTGGNSDA
jgi:hypothetical protein